MCVTVTNRISFLTLEPSSLSKYCILALAWSCVERPSRVSGPEPGTAILQKLISYCRPWFTNWPISCNSSHHPWGSFHHRPASSSQMPLLSRYSTSSRNSNFFFFRLRVWNHQLRESISFCFQIISPFLLRIHILKPCTERRLCEYWCSFLEPSKKTGSDLR